MHYQFILLTRKTKATKMLETDSLLKKKFKNNFFLTKTEKELFFTLKELHKLNNKLGSINDDYSKFIQDMNHFYKNIISNLSK